MNLFRHLSTQRNAGSQRGPARYRPALDRLEDRTVLSSFEVIGGTLTIEGDAKRDLIIVNDEGDGNVDFWVARPEDALAIAFGLVPPETASGIHTINIDTNWARDHVIYTQTDTRADAMTLNVRLGWGADTFEAHIDGPLFFGVPLNLTVDGGYQRDRITVDATDVSINDDAELNVLLKGGDGLADDHLALTYEGELDGLLNFTLRGEGGNDVLHADVVVDAFSDGSLRGRLRGNQGADSLFFHVVEQDEDGPFTILDAVADGGLGFDRCDTTPNVRRVSC